MKTTGKITHHWQLDDYDRLIGKLVTMQNKPEPWLLLRSNKRA